MARTGSGKKQDATTQNIEAILWAAADKLRGHMDAAEYKHVVLGLIFLKYISDAFEERHAELLARELGRVGLTAIGTTAADAQSRFEQVQALLLDGAGEYAVA